MTTDVYVYNRVTNSRTASRDILEIIEDIDRALQTDVEFNELVTDAYVSDIISDGGAAAPTEVYRVSIYLSYITHNDYNK